MAVYETWSRIFTNTVMGRIPCTENAGTNPLKVILNVCFLGRPIRRILYSALLGTTAAAICYPKYAVDVTLANYDRLKVFTKKQLNTFNQKREEQPAIKELGNPVEEAVVSESQDKPVEEVGEIASVKQNENQVEGDKVGENTTQSDVAVEDKPKASFWSKIPFVDKIIGSKESVVSSNMSSVASSKGDGATEDEPTKDQVIVQEESTSQADVEGDIGQSNPEDKDMYSTRS